MNIQTLRKYEDDRWLYSQVHPTLPLIIWNYSQFTQYENYWDEITLNCRGLVTDYEGNVISKGFKKFFNYSEGKTDIPTEIEYLELWEKVDGSYIGLFFYGDDWILNSKGSFTSDHVGWAKEILLDGEFDLNTLNKNWTYCFELVHPQNRIVVDYKDERALYFLSAFCGGVEIEEIYPKELQNTCIKFPKLVQLNSFSAERLQKKNRKNEEGYVVKFKNYERCKIKFEEYLRLHRIVTNTTSYDIWECLKDGHSFDEILDRIPDEYYPKVKNWKNSIMKKFFKIKAIIYNKYSEILDIESEKEFAIKIQNNKYKSLLFNIRKGIDVDKQIIKKCKPKYEKL